MAYSNLCSRPIASAVSWFKYRPVRAIFHRVFLEKVVLGARGTGPSGSMRLSETDFCSSS
jgi:hypothetical protein